MIGHLQAMSQFSSIKTLGAAALLSTMILALPGAAQAGQASADMVNGQYCNAMCKAYMAWSNRMLAITQPSYARPQMRVAVPQTATPQKNDKAERTEPRMTQHPPKPHRPANLNSFAQVPSGTRAAQPAMDAPQTQTDDGSAAYAGAQMGRMLSTDPQPAVAGLRGSTDGADMRLVPISDTGLAQDSRTVGDASGSPRSRMPSIWIMIAAAALLAFFGHGWLKRRTAANHELN
ncbi:hypothetical protein [Bradyrhizobium sp. STM 3809]|uniref:hypothetical protein n=1 Tax=Bradyrhizobium sp. STM 3809 TaxID=551936 RepID=UPI0002409190|nr:hypothetical protein [Bradyrhizobium sp. STM 3809]CCD97959.1 conserved exported hypothetical protein [Bradyrhizobium sp. STM 3809]